MTFSSRPCACPWCERLGPERAHPEAPRCKVCHHVRLDGPTCTTCGHVATSTPPAEAARITLDVRRS